ncbi:hypothetical protein IJO12_01525 [bacterium]|nr:hypothetical protein [bacterium]
MKVSLAEQVPTINNKATSFKGTPLRAPQIPIKDYSDAIRSWEYLRHAKYLDVHDDKFHPSNKYIREANYSFLDKLNDNIDKYMFIGKFCEFTGFPNLRKVSDKIHKTFIDCVNRASTELSSKIYDDRYTILDAGYDPTCSLGIKKAFPGSDLDKGYIIIEGCNSSYGDNNACNEIKGYLWENLDQRIVSLNHPDTAVDVYTEDQISDTLNWLNPIAENLNLINTLRLFLPHNYIGYQLNELFKDPLDPYEAAEFNREIKFKLHGSSEKEKAKNFAFFIETVRENLENENDYIKFHKDLFNDIKESEFATHSNVTQIPAWKQKIAHGYKKQKLINRERLENDFYKMETDKKYELIKEIIKYSSNDQGHRFSEYFKNDDDIANRYDRLLAALK